MSWAEALANHRDVLDSCAELAQDIDQVVAALARVLRRGGKVMVCGNGGSAAHAQHFAAELVVRYQRNRPALAAIALGSNPAILTATINDLSPDDIFVRELHALVGSNDALFAISTSGRSTNVCRALDAADGLELITIGLTGASGMAAPVDFEIRVPSSSTPRIQEIHTLIIHAICEGLDD